MIIATTRRHGGGGAAVARTVLLTGRLVFTIFLICEVFSLSRVEKCEKKASAALISFKIKANRTCWRLTQFSVEIWLCYLALQPNRSRRMAFCFSLFFVVSNTDRQVGIGFKT
jgi:hypothetical protein